VEIQKFLDKLFEAKAKTSLTVDELHKAGFMFNTKDMDKVVSAMKNNKWDDYSTEFFQWNTIPNSVSGVKHDLINPPSQKEYKKFEDAIKNVLNKEPEIKNALNAGIKRELAEINKSIKNETRNKNKDLPGVKWWKDQKDSLTKLRNNLKEENLI
jgi:hypothetical protein